MRADETAPESAPARSRPDSAVARENARVEAILQVQLVLHSDALREADELRAAGKKDVLAVVDFDAVDLERRRAAAEQAAALEELDVRAGILQVERRRSRPARPRSDDRYALDSHDRTTTRSFSVFESAARARNGSPGSRSIFLSSSS